MYTVKEGDTLGAIAREHNVNYRDLARWNNIDDPNRIRPSQQLRLSEP
jgi:lipoprotein NlpD